MATKIIVLGSPDKVDDRVKTPIKLISFLDFNGGIRQSGDGIRDGRSIGELIVTEDSRFCGQPIKYNYVELVAKNYTQQSDPKLTEDLIFCYENPARRGEGMLYIGQWNDGVVE